MSQVTIVDKFYSPDNEGMIEVQCNHCDNHCIEPHSQRIKEYRYCPHCGIDWSLDLHRTTLSDSADATSKCLKDIRSLLDGNLPEESIEEIEDIVIRHFG